MTTKVELITPKIAMDILENHNPRNRNVSDGTVSSYAMDMKNNRWTLTHQGIAFDENGDLIDGQHRLWAVVFSEKEIEFNVTRGIPVKQNKGGIEINSMDNIDHMRARSAGSQLSLCHGIKNGNQVSAGLRGIALMIDPKNGRGRISTANTLFLYEQYGADVERIIGAMTSGKKVSCLLAPLAMYHHAEPDKAITFCQQICTLENMTPATRYCVKFLEQTKGRTDLDRTMRIVAKCIHGFHEGREFKTLQDDFTGIKWLCCMYPSLNKRIADAIQPVKGMKIKRNLNGK